MKIFLATKNEGKIKDFKKLTEGMDIEVVSILDNIMHRLFDPMAGLASHRA